VTVSIAAAFRRTRLRSCTRERILLLMKRLSKARRGRQHRPGESPLVTLRHTRYQAAVVQNGAILLVRCQFVDGSASWMLPGGGREDDEDDVECVVREVAEETLLCVRVERLLSDMPAQPPDGTYTRWRTYLCTVVSGEAGPGGGEGSSATLTEVTWLPLSDQQRWPDDIRADLFLYPQLIAVYDLIGSPMSLNS